MLGLCENRDNARGPYILVGSTLTETPVTIEKNQGAGGGSNLEEIADNAEQNIQQADKNSAECEPASAENYLNRDIRLSYRSKPK